MFENLVQNDSVLGTRQFISDEVQYNLIHRITESENSTCFKTTDDQMIFAQSEGHNAWLWISKDATVDQKKLLIRELVNHLDGHPLPGVSGDPPTVEAFAERYSKINEVQYHTNMLMESYFCPEVSKPLHVKGAIHPATRQDVETVAHFFAGFSEGAYGVSVDPESQRPAAEEAVDSGKLYLWMVDQVPVSMANVAHRSPRHGRINAVFTPPLLRQQGFASAIVAELCLMLGQERLIPMLYADMQNPASNKIYKNIGFVESGQIADIKFSDQS